MSNVENIKEKVLEIINSNIEKEKITIEQKDEDLVALGMDSLKFISIVVALEADFEIEYPDESLLITESNTLNKLVSIVSGTLEKKNAEGATE